MKQKTSDNKLNSDNSGFSLVELLIAMLILAIITIPFLNLFVNATKVNGKARKILRATTVAQDIAEGMKSYDLEALKKEFWHSGTLDDALLMRSDWYTHDEVSVNDFAVIAHSGLEDKGGGFLRESYVDDERNIVSGNYKNSYVFTLKGIEFENSKFDAVITANPNRYVSENFKDKSEVYKTLNDNNVTAIYSVNAGNYIPADSKTRKDGAYTLGTDAERKILEKIKSIDNGVLTYEDIKITKRDINIEFSELPGTLNLLQANISAKYYYVYGTNPENSVEVSNSEMGLMGGLTCQYDDIEGSFCNYYFYYTPLYSYRGAFVPEDNIYITTNTDKNIRLFIIKQKYKSSMYKEGISEDNWDKLSYIREIKNDSTYLHDEENKYKVNIYCLHPLTYGLLNLRIRTNLGQCLAKDAADVGTYINNYQFVFKSGQTSAWADSVDYVKNIFFDLSGNQIVLDEGDLKGFDDAFITNRIMDIKVEVFEHDDAFGADIVSPLAPDVYGSHKNDDALATISATISN